MDEWRGQDELATRAGVIVPAYFSAKPPDDLVRRLLWMTLVDTPHYLPLEHVCVVVDGDARTARLAAEVRERLRQRHGATFQLLSLPENRGKLWAMREGAQALLASCPEIDFIAVRDGDGDHALADLPALLRAALHLCEAQGSQDVIVIGARRTRHHPMGWLRGELETLLDQVTLDALAYALARRGVALDLSQCSGALPDLSSGYKLYGRVATERLFGGAEHPFASLSETDYWHYGPETCTMVEALLHGTRLGEIQRLTWDGQPTTSFGEFSCVALYGELLAWVFARLELPLAVAARLYDNHAPHRPLRTTAEGRSMLDEVRQYALYKAQAYRGGAEAIPAAPDTLPFV